MSDCLKCSYTKGEPKGARVCKKCARPENVPKGSARSMTAPEVGQAHPPIVPVPSTSAPVTSSETDASISIIASPLPDHSRMGGSAAHRFLNCTGSTALIAGLKLVDEIDPDYRRDGVQAHELGARCLDTDADAWELVSEYPIAPDQATAVQVYVDHVRSLPGRRRVEVKLHLPDLHPLMFSTLDAVLDPVLGDVALHIVDYKHGEGVYVEAENNEQLMYYACMAIMERPVDFDDTDRVELTICQPRVAWAEPVRSWRTTVGELKAWLYDVLLPAMRLEAQDMHLQMGEWCRFCPAKLVCPAMSQAFSAFAGATTELAALSNEVLGRDYALTATVKMRIKAVEQEVFRRRMEGVEVPGTKLVLQKTDRVWKTQVESPDGSEVFTLEEAMSARFGKALYTEPKLLSPAALEKLPEGKAFVSEWAYKPEAGYTVALADDPRAAVVPRTPDEKYGDPARFANAAEVP